MKRYLTLASILFLVTQNLYSQVNGRIISPSFSPVSNSVAYSFNASSSSIVITNKNSYKLEIYNIFPNCCDVSGPNKNGISNELATVLPGESTELPANYKGTKYFRSIAYKASDVELKAIPGESQESYSQRYNKNQQRGCELVKLQAQMEKEICQLINGTASCYSYASSILETNNWCDNSSSQASNYQTQSNNNIFNGTNSNTTNRTSPNNQPQTNLQKTQQAINNSIDDITNSVVADMNKKHEEELKKINDSYNNSQNNSSNQGMPIEALSNDKSNANPNDGYFPIRSFSDVATFIKLHYFDISINHDGILSSSSCNEDGVLKLTIGHNSDKVYTEWIYNLKNIQPSSFFIVPGANNLAVAFTGDEIYRLNYYKNGKFKDYFTKNRFWFYLDKSLLDDNKQYILRNFVESLQALIRGESKMSRQEVNTPQKSRGTITKDDIIMVSDVKVNLNDEELKLYGPMLTPKLISIAKTKPATKAIELYKLAARRDNVEAMIAIADLYEGDGYPSDGNGQLALKWYTTAAIYSDIYAMMKAANILEYGKYNSFNLQKAIEIYSHALNAPGIESFVIITSGEKAGYVFDQPSAVPNAEPLSKFLKGHIQQLQLDEWVKSDVTKVHHGGIKEIFRTKN